MALTNEELAAKLLKQPRAQVALELDDTGDVYGAMSVYTTWDVATGTQLVIVSASPETKGTEIGS